MWRIPDDEPNVPRLRKERRRESEARQFRNIEAIGFIHDFTSDLEE